MSVSVVKPKSDEREDVLRYFAELAKEKGQDSFLVKVYRRSPNLAAPTHVATLAGAQLFHLASAEEWLTQLAGGGPQFLLEVYHASDSVIMAGKLTFNIAGGPREVDTAIVKRSDWTGPAEMRSPKPPAAAKNDPVFMSRGEPGAAAAPLAATGLQAPSGALPDMRVEAALARIEARERALEQQQHDQQLAAQKRDYESRLAQMEQQIRLGAQQPKPSLVDTLTPLVAALAPLLQEVMKSNQEARLEALRLQELARKDAMEMQRQQSATNTALLEAAMKRPAVDPAVQALVDKMERRMEKDRDGHGGQSGMVSEMAEAFTKMTHTTMRLVTAAAEMTAAESGDEPVQLTVVKEAVRGVMSLADAWKASILVKKPGVPAPAAVQPAALPQGAPAPEQPPAPAQSAAPPPAAPPPRRNFTALDKLEGKIRERQNTAAVAAEFLSILNLPDVQSELAAAEGNPAELFFRRLGQPWIDESPLNEIYARDLLSEVTKQAEQAGLMNGGGEQGEEIGAEA